MEPEPRVCEREREFVPDVVVLLTGSVLPPAVEVESPAVLGETECWAGGCEEKLWGACLLCPRRGLSEPSKPPAEPRRELVGPCGDVGVNVAWVEECPGSDNSFVEMGGWGGMLCPLTLFVFAE